MPEPQPSPILLRRSRASLMLAMILGACGGFALRPLRAEPPQSAQAQPTGTGPGTITVDGRPETRIGGAPADPGPCVAVDVAGHKAGTTDCAAAKLQDAARAAQARAQDDPMLAVPHAGSADTTVGVGSLTGSSQRLGADLRGRTTLPTRPTPPPPPPNPFARQP